MTAVPGPNALATHLSVSAVSAAAWSFVKRSCRCHGVSMPCLPDSQVRCLALCCPETVPWARWGGVADLRQKTRNCLMKLIVIFLWFRRFYGFYDDAWKCFKRLQRVQYLCQIDRAFLFSRPTQWWPASCRQRRRVISEINGIATGKFWELNKFDKLWWYSKQQQRLVFNGFESCASRAYLMISLLGKNYPFGF